MSGREGSAVAPNGKVFWEKYVVCVILFSDQSPVLGSVLRNTDFVVAGVLCEPRKESEGDHDQWPTHKDIISIKLWLRFKLFWAGLIIQYDFSQNNAVQVICEWSGAGVTTMSSRYSTQCYSKCEIIIQSNLEFGICQKRYWNPHDLINHWRYLTILGDTWRYLTCIPFSFLLFPLFFSSASVSITGIAPPGGLLSAAPKPWDQVAQVDCLSRWFCTYLILKMSLNFDWPHSLYWSWNNHQ